MPALSAPPFLNSLVDRAAFANATSSPFTANGTAVSHPLQVVCAWPVSGQYGPGSRLLYVGHVNPFRNPDNSTADKNAWEADRSFQLPPLRYYVLVAACVLARKISWLRNPCLAATLLFPAVAALHGIVLAALHVDGQSCIGCMPSI